MPPDFSTLQTAWSFPTTVWFGSGRLKDLPTALEACGASRPLLVTDSGLAATGLVEQARAVLAGAGMDCAVFTDVKPNPTGGNVAAGVAAVQAGGHDAVIAFGGGSALDAGKAIALMAGQTRPLWDFEDIGDNWRQADPAGMVPVVAIPTTAGTGSELGRSSVITDTDAHRKVIIFHPDMMPDVVILDPALTVGLPPTLTAATGMDALAHCLEAYCAPTFHPMAEGIALQGMHMIKDWLPVAYRDGKSLEARAHMLVASAMGCVALQKGLGAVHALAHPLGARYDAHHGMLNAVLLPHVLRHNAPALEAKLDRLCRWLALPGAAGPAAFIAWIETLRSDLDVPDRLSGMEVQVSDADLPAIAEAAAKDPCAAGNPVPLTPDALAGILGAAR